MSNQRESADQIAETRLFTLTYVETVRDVARAAGKFINIRHSSDFYNEFIFQLNLTQARTCKC